MSPSSLADLIDRQAATLVLYARQWTVTPEDVVQEAFCRLVRQQPSPTEPVAWLYHVTRNLAQDAGKSERRRRSREEQVAKTEWFVEHGIDGLDAEKAIACLTQLPGDQREVLVARLWGGLTFEQIAAAHDCSVSTAHRRYELAIKALRERLGVECPKKT